MLYENLHEVKQQLYLYTFFSKYMKYGHIVNHDDTSMSRQRRCLLSLSKEVRGFPHRLDLDLRPWFPNP